MIEKSTGTSSIEPTSTHTHSKSKKQGKIVTVRRLISTPAFVSTLHVKSSTRQRVVVTKKRPVVKSELQTSVTSISKQSTDHNVQSTAVINSEVKNSDLITPVSSKSEAKSSDFITPKSEPKIALETEKSNFEQISTVESTIKETTTVVSDVVPTILPSVEVSSIIESSFQTSSESASSSSTPKLNSEIIVEETSYDGPKYVRPTRFVVTHKPSDEFFKRIQSARTNAKIILPSRRSSKIRSTPAYLTKYQTTNEVNSLSLENATLVLQPSSNNQQPISVENTDSTINTQTSDITFNLTKLATQTQLKTFTHVVTRINGDEKFVTTTYEVKPIITTLTKLVQPTMKDGTQARLNMEEARMNLATRVMNNGVEVIVADRSAGETLRIAPSSIRTGFLEPSTLTEHMLSLLPEHEPQASLIKSLRSDTSHLTTRTLQTVYTHLTSHVKSGETKTSSREYVITNVVTGGKDQIAPTKSIAHVTVTSGYDKPKYDTNTFQTTYLYMNTILDGEVPIVVTSKETVANTFTGISDLQPSETMLETNTYYNTYTFTKTLNDEKGGKFTSKHRNIVTQVVVTEAPSMISVQSSKSAIRPTATTDIIKTYFVTYTYFNTFLEKGSTITKTNIAISSDVVTEKFYLSPKRTSIPESTKISAEIGIAPTITEALKVYATKTYLTTFTYFTTLLQGKSTVTSSSTKLVYNVVTEAITSGLDSLYLDSLRSSFAAQTSHEPIVTTVMLEGEALEITAVQPTASKLASQVSVTSLSPSFEHVVTGSTIIFLDDEPQISINNFTTPPSKVNLTPQVFTGDSTIFFSDNKKVNNTDTPEYLLSSLESGVSSTVKQEFLTSTLISTTVLPNESGPATTLVPGDKVILLTRPDGNVTMIPVSDPHKKKRPPNKNEDDEDDDDDDDLEIDEDDLKVADLSTGGSGPVAAEIGVSDLLNFGQFSMNGLNALGPVINAMAGLIQSQISTGQSKKNATTVIAPPKSTTPFPAFIQPKNPSHKQPIAAQREPVYIPVGGLGNSAHSVHLSSEKHVPGFAESVRPDLPIEDNENAGSSWIDSLPIQGGVNERIPLMDRPPQSQIILGRPTMESPLLQDGISIQPGQVITANSDVIVGKPSVLGPRPRPGPQNTNGPIQRPDLSDHVITHAEKPILVQGPRPKPGPPHHSFDRRPPQVYQVDFKKQQLPNDINPQVLHHNHPPPKAKQPLPNKPNQNANIAIGMRPPPLPPPQNFNPTKVISGAHTVFLADQFAGNQYSLPHAPSHHNFIKGNVERSTETIRPSQTLVIHGASTQFFSPESQIIHHGTFDNSPIPLPETEPGFIGVSNIGVSDHHYDDVGHVITGTINEPPDIPQQLGGVILGNPDTMPVLQPGSKVKVPVLSENEHGGSQGIDHLHFNNNNQPNHHFGGQEINIDSNIQTVNIHKPKIEVIGPSLHISRPNFNKPPNIQVGRPHFENNVGGNILPHRHESRPLNIPIQRPPQSAFIRPPFDKNRVSNGPNLHQTPIDMKPPPIPQLNLPSRPEESFIGNFAPPPVPYPDQQRPGQHPMVIPIHHESHSNSQPDFKQPSEIYISPDSNSDISGELDEPEREEGEYQGELVEESNPRPVLPFDIPRKPVDETSPDYERDDIVTKRPYVSTHRPNHIITNEPSYYNPDEFDRPAETEIITKLPSVSFNNQDISKTDIVTAAPPSSSHNPIFVPPPAPSDNRRPTFVINNLEPESQGSTPRPFVFRPPWPPTSEKTPLLPMPDQNMNPPPPPEPASHDKPPSVSSKPRVPVIDANLQDSTHRPTVHIRPPPRPKPSSPYQFEFPDRQRPTPFKVNNRNKDRIPSENSASETSISLDASIEDRVPSQRPTLRPRPSRPPVSSRPINLRPSRPSVSINSRPAGVLPPVVLEPPSPPPNIEPQLSVPSEPSLQTVVSIEGDNKIVRTNVFNPEETAIRPTKTVTVFETVNESSRRRIVSSRPYRPNKSRTPYKPPTEYTPTVEESVEYWPDDGDIEATPSYAITSDIIKSTVTVTPGFSRRPKPSNSIHKQYSSIARENLDNIKPITSVVTVEPKPTTRFVTHTETFTVTSTETTVLSSRGLPVTRTVVVTQTEAPRTVVSTIVGTVTEIHTLDPSTVTTTVSVATRQPEIATAHPDFGNYPVFTVRPHSSAPLPPTQNADEVEGDYEPEADLDTGAGYANNNVDRTVGSGGAIGGDRPFSVDEQQPPSPGECNPECDVTKNELCQETSGRHQCVCRPGFARIFPGRPCTPTYTYRMRLQLDSARGEKLRYKTALSDSESAEYRDLAKNASDGVRRAAMRSELRDMFHGAYVTGFSPATSSDKSDLARAEDGVNLNFYVQLSENIEEKKLEEKFLQSLQTTNFSLGGTEVFAARETGLEASDFDECANGEFHDCSEHSQCFNLRGTYTCSCKDGYSDLSPSSRFPGRVCSAEVLGCDRCNYHGTCYTLGRGDERQHCDCFQWYAGESCNINLKALLIALVTLGAIMLLLLLLCLVLTCLKKRQHNKAAAAGGPGFMRYRGPGGAQVGRGTLDKAAMLQETSSESSGDHSPLPYMTPVHPVPGKVGGRGRGGGKLDTVAGEAGYVTEQDRSLTVMIPRAKYRPVQASTSVLSMSTFAAPTSPNAGTSGGSPSNAEHKLLSYLEAGASEKPSSGSGGKRKQSGGGLSHHSHADAAPRKSSAPRKPSTGALVSAGFEVSAQVTRSALRGGGGGGQGEHLTLASHRSGFTTLRTGDSKEACLMSSSESGMACHISRIVPQPPPLPPSAAATVSEARSYDETLVQPPTRSLLVRGGGQPASTYGSKPGSSRHDGQTMAERDVGSTFLMPQSQLYKPSRGQGSDASNFDSL